MLAIKCNPQGPDNLFTSTESSIRNRIDRILKQKSVRINKKNLPISSDLSVFLNDLLKGDNLKELICLNAIELQQYINQNILIHPKFFSSKSFDGKILYRIFVDYGYEILNKWNLLQDININSCPYCNRSYIFTIDSNKKVKPEIDHFYPKHLYPLVACSYYNLIPSCSICNGIGGKFISDTYRNGAINPYLIDNKERLFDYELINSEGKLKVSLINKNSVQNSMFNINDLYEKHNDVVEELFIRSKMEYSVYYRESLKKISGIHITDDLINRVIVGNYTAIDDLNKRPLSKLTRDIALKLGLINE